MLPFSSLTAKTILGRAVERKPDLGADLVGLGDPAGDDRLDVGGRRPTWQAAGVWGHQPAVGDPLAGQVRVPLGIDRVVGAVVRAARAERSRR